jgi:hypothetical protein
MNWRKWNFALHRDIGYLCVGLTILYAISGVAVNHVDDWNPSYEISKENISIGKIDRADVIVSKEEVDAIIKKIGATGKFKNYHQSTKDTLKIFLVDNTISIDLEKGVVEQKISKRRFLLFESNFLHLNHPKRLWTYVADLYAVGLLFLALSGFLFMFGKKKIKLRGAVFTIIGFAIPIVFLGLYM